MRGYSQRIKKLGANLQKVGKIASISLTAPVTAFGASIGKVVVDYDTQMNLVRGLTSANADQFQALSAQAREMGRTTVFSAVESAEAMQRLAQAGFDTDKILGALPNTLALAGAGSLTLADAARIAAGTLKGFRLDTSELGRVADVLSFSAASAMTDVQEIGEAFKFAASTSKASGISLEETSAIIQALSDSMIRGEMGGTALSGAITSLVKPSREAQQTLARLGVAKKDLITEDGQLTGFISFIERLNEVKAQPADIFTIFGQRPGRAVQALLGQVSEDADSLRKRMILVQESATGTAARLNRINLEGLPGAVRLLSSAWDELRLSVGDAGFREFATNTVTALRSAMETVSALPKPLLLTASKVAGLTAALGPALIGLGLLVKTGGFALGGLVKLGGGLKLVAGALQFMAGRALLAAAPGLGALAAGARVAAIAFTTKAIPAVLSFGAALFANPIGLVIGGVAALGVAGVALYRNWDRVADFFVGIWDRIKGAFGSGVEWITAKLDGLSLGPVLSFLGLDDAPTAAPVNTARATSAVGPRAGQDGRARVEVEVIGNGQNVRANATEIDDVDLTLDQGLVLGAF